MHPTSGRVAANVTLRGLHIAVSGLTAVEHRSSNVVPSRCREPICYYSDQTCQRRFVSLRDRARMQPVPVEATMRKFS